MSLVKKVTVEDLKVMLEQDATIPHGDFIVAFDPTPVHASSPMLQAIVANMPLYQCTDATPNNVYELTGKTKYHELPALVRFKHGVWKRVLTYKDFDAMHVWTMAFGHQ